MHQGSVTLKQHTYNSCQSCHYNSKLAMFVSNHVLYVFNFVLCSGFTNHSRERVKLSHCVCVCVYVVTVFWKTTLSFNQNYNIATFVFLRLTPVNMRTSFHVIFMASCSIVTI